MSREPTDEERQLWLRFTRDVERLREDAELPDLPAADEVMGEPRSLAISSSTKKQIASEAATENSAVGSGEVTGNQAQSQRSFDRLKAGDSAGVDAQTYRRFRQGKLPLDGTLDLHGMNREQAAYVFTEYLQSSQLSGKRVICVITGHGIGRQGTPGGVLREALPQWVNWPENKARIITFNQALPKYGGQGAYMVLLRRLRD